MKKLLICLMLCLAVKGYATLDYCADVQIRAGGYYPESKCFREIYAKWVPDYQLEISKPIYGNISGWFNLTHLRKHGKSLGFKTHTLWRLTPLSLGAKYTYCINPCWNIYGGLGATYAYLNQHNHSPFVKNDRKWAWGGVAKAGFQYNLTRHLFIDVFVDYLYLKYNLHSRNGVKKHSSNANGLEGGVGLGLRI